MLHALLTAAASNALAAAALAGAAALASRRCRPAVAHGLWLLVLLKLVTPPLLPVAVPWPAGTEAPRAEKAPGPRAPAADEVPARPAGGRPAMLGPVVSAESPSAPALPAAAPAPYAPSPPEAPPWRVPWEEAVAAAWLAGSLAWWAVAGLRLARFHRALRAVRPAPEGVQGQARRLAGLLGLRRCPGVWLVPAPVSPMLLALGRSPRLLLPAALWGRLDGGQRDALLAHELAHLRRRDHWVRRLELVVLGLYWWHPVAWWARRRLQEAEEECCDAWVVWALPGLAPAYAAALVETVAFVSQTRPALPAGASGAGQVPLLKRRLTMILRGTGPRSLSRPGVWALLGLGALLLPLAPTGARPAAPPEPDAKPAPRVAEWQRGDPHRGLNLVTAVDTKQCLQCHALPDKEWERLRAQPDAWTKAHAEVIRLMQEVQTSRANLQKTEARLKDALERMDSLMRTDPHGKPAEGGKPAPSDQRLKDLEKKLDRLLDEVDALRREVRPKKTGEAPAGPRGNVWSVNQRAFQIPFRAQPEAHVRQLVLYVSRDQGKTWELAAKATPTDKAFSFEAPADGDYWFTIQTRDRDGRFTPDSVTGAKADLKVYVNTAAPAVGH